MRAWMDLSCGCAVPSRWNRALTSPFIHVLNRERVKAEGALADALQKVAELEDQLDKAGGDAAAERQAMRALEAANKEGLEEVG